MAQILALYYYAYFLVILPVLGLRETPSKQPDSISVPVLSSGAGGHGMPAGALAAPEKKG